MLNSTPVTTLGKHIVVQTASVSERGPIREHNEDSIAIIRSADHGLPEKGTVLIVADGMGGMDAGARASAMVTTNLPSLYLGSDIPDPADCLVQSVIDLNRLVYEEGRKSFGGRGMGSTAVVAVIVNDSLITVNVGDSRAYTLRNGNLWRLSKDHSMSNDLFSPLESRTQDFSHVLTQAIGPQARIAPHLNICQVSAGDMILLCSDGLTSVVSDEEIEDILRTSCFSRSVDALVARVFANEGDDNISVIVAKVGEVAP